MDNSKQEEKIPVILDGTKFEESQRYIVRTLTSLGIPLVLRSEQNITLEEEAKRDILSTLEENSKIKTSLQETNQPILEDDEYVLKVANFYFATGNNQKAIDMYENILLKNPSKMAALNNKGVVFDSKGEYEIALKNFNEALKKVPENVHVLSNMGIALYKSEKYQQALECFDQALKIDSGYINALTFKAHSLYRLGRNADALEWYNMVLRQDRNNAEALYNKACLCSLKGDTYGAITSLEKAVKIDLSWRDTAMQDKDLDRLRSNPRFLDILKTAYSQ